MGAIEANRVPASFKRVSNSREIIRLKGVRKDRKFRYYSLRSNLRRNYTALEYRALIGGGGWGARYTYPKETCEERSYERSLLRDELKARDKGEIRKRTNRLFVRPSVSSLPKKNIFRVRALERSVGIENYFDAWQTYNARLRSNVRA